MILFTVNFCCYIKTSFYAFRPSPARAAKYATMKISVHQKIFPGFTDFQYIDIQDFCYFHEL